MKKFWKSYIAVVSIIAIIFLFVVNYATSPDYMWAFFALLPIVLLNIILLNARRAKSFTFSMVGCIVTILCFVVLSKVMGSTHPYYLYISFVVLWWPLVHYLIISKNHLLFSVLGYILTAGFFFTVNKVTSPESVWYIYPTISLILWPVTALFITMSQKNNRKSA